MLDRCPEEIDRWTEVDALRLPDRWRPAARCAASLLATRFEAECGGLSLRTLRGRRAQLHVAAGAYRSTLDDPQWYTP